MKTPLIDSRFNRQFIKRWHPSKKLVCVAILGVFTAVLQSAGGMLPGVGLAISPFSTIIVVLATMISLQYGLFTYLLAIFLLFLIEPSELFIFPFTTGLLGLGIGLGLCKLNKPAAIILVNGIILCLGICIPLYGLGFPILGPMVLATPKIKTLLTIFIFASLYSWLWLELSLHFLCKINKFLS